MQGWRFEQSALKKNVGNVWVDAVFGEAKLYGSDMLQFYGAVQLETVQHISDG